MLAARNAVLSAPVLALLAVLAAPAAGAPPQFVPVDDPVMAELRVLDLMRPDSTGPRLALPHLDATPLQALEILRATGGGDWAEVPPGARGIAMRRVLRALGRDAAGGDAAAPWRWPRAFEREWPAAPLRLEVSGGVEGARDFGRGDADPAHPDRWRDGSGLHLRTGVQVDRWFAYSHLFFGELHGVRAFSDALVNNSDLAASTEESYVAYSAGPAWSAQLGRDRWQWGPGEDGTLLLSRTSAPLTGLMLHARIEPLRADGFVFSATVDPGRGEQMAAHRIEWQPSDGVRLGIAEAARYHAGGWQGLYLAGVVPYAVVQKLLDQDHPDSSGALRNNVMVAVDASLRVADGARLYGEVLVDDLHLRTAEIPNKWGWQVGGSGFREVAGTRVTCNAEATWLSRWVYTSFYGESYAAQERPIGFPTGPGSRRLRARLTWDPDAAWQIEALAERTESGREGLADAFVPGSAAGAPGALVGPVERTTSVGGTVRWWPAAGVDVSLGAARGRAENAVHLAGATREGWQGTFALRVTR